MCDPMLFVAVRIFADLSTSMSRMTLLTTLQSVARGDVIVDLIRQYRSALTRKTCRAGGRIAIRLALDLGIQKRAQQHAIGR